MATSGHSQDCLQANFVILPEKYAADFTAFCALNAKTFPLLDITKVGSPVPERVAPSADLRTDLPKYKVFKHGRLVSEPSDITDLWQHDFVGFLTGCSFTFDSALESAGIPNRHIEQGITWSGYRTNLDCRPVGPFKGKIVVSMRPMTLDLARKAMAVTAPLSWIHGAPIHAGDPGKIGIQDLQKPDFGQAVSLAADEMPVFWACGDTLLDIMVNAKLPIAITHYPPHMFRCDISGTDYEPFPRELLNFQ